MERVLREVAEKQKPAVIFGDAFGNEEAVRRVAKDFPEIAFVFGSGGGPAEPNFSVFDNWIHEPAYLSGMLAGGLTKSNVIGVVGGHAGARSEPHRQCLHRRRQGSQPRGRCQDAPLSTAWFDPAAAKEAALAQIDAGADVLFAERFGVIEAAAENGLCAFGNMSDQKELAPDYVVSGPVWNMQPTVDYIVNQVRPARIPPRISRTSAWSAKGGATLAPINMAVICGLTQELVDRSRPKKNEIKNGLFRVDIAESPPPASSAGQ